MKQPLKTTNMTKIKVFKTNRVLSIFFLVFGAVFTILGTALIIKASIKGFDIKFPSGDWNSVIYTIEGLLFIIMGSATLINKKYFIEWDQNELRFLLPDTKKIETIKFEDITSVNTRLFEIHLTLGDKTRILDLNNLQFEDLRKIKEKFEELNGNPIIDGETKGRRDGGTKGRRD
jgi:hypothetical protein